MRDKAGWFVAGFFVCAFAATLTALVYYQDIFTVERDGVPRLTVTNPGTVTINTDSTNTDVALKITGTSTTRGDLRYPVRSTDPSSPQQGDMWYNDAEKIFKFYTGSSKYRLGFWDSSVQTVLSGTSTTYNGTRGANSGTASDDPTWTTDAKLGGSALTFDGTNDYMSVPDSDPLDLIADCTVEVWAKSNDLSSPRWIMEKQPATATSYAMIMYADGHASFIIYNTASTDYLLVSSGTGLDDGNWRHFAATLSGTTLRLYVNGILVDTDTTTSGTRQGATTGVLQIGASAGVNNWDGSLDEVAVWNRALTAAEITARYNGGAGSELAGNESGLVSVWHLNDPK